MYVVGVGGSGPGGFREVSGKAFEVCAGLGEKLQGPESPGERVRTSAQVHITRTVKNTNKYDKCILTQSNEHILFFQNSLEKVSDLTFMKTS